MVQLKMDRVGDYYLLEENGEIHLYWNGSCFVVGSCHVDQSGSVRGKEGSKLACVFTNGCQILLEYEKGTPLYRDRVIWLWELMRCRP